MDNNLCTHSPLILLPLEWRESEWSPADGLTNPTLYPARFYCLPWFWIIETFGNYEGFYSRLLFSRHFLSLIWILWICFLSSSVLFFIYIFQSHRVFFLGTIERRKIFPHLSWRKCIPDISQLKKRRKENGLEMLTRYLLLPVWKEFCLFFFKKKYAYPQPSPKETNISNGTQSLATLLPNSPCSVNNSVCKWLLYYQELQHLRFQISRLFFKTLSYPCSEW